MDCRKALATALFVVAAQAATAAGSYDILFRTGTLDDLAPGTEIVYDQSGDAATDASGAGLDLRLTVESPAETYLDLVNAEAFRRIGVFPTDVGNPLLMYALETAVRDIAELTGGSPFYIRNRFKDALAGEPSPQPVTVPFEGDEVAADRVVLHPFRADPEAARFPGLGDLEIAVDVSPEVPGWYHAISIRMPPDGTYDLGITISGGEAG